MAVNAEFHDDVGIYLSSVISSISAEKRGSTISQSWLSTPDSTFLGLFTTRDFQAGERVCIYQGIRLKTADALHLQDKSYLMRLGPQCYIDARPCPYIPARFINDCINPAGWNVAFEKHPELDPPCAYVIALRDLKVGEEVFVDYGRWYWAGCALTPRRISFGELHKLRGPIA